VRHVGGEVARLARGVRSKVAHVLADIARRVGGCLGGVAGLRPAGELAACLKA
jgi:hypothetical protein